MYCPCYDYDSNIWWRVTATKLTRESYASLCSYHPLISNILLTTLLSQTFNLCSSLDTRHQISHPQQMTGTMSVLQISTCNILNWKVASIAWTYPALSSKITVLLTFCQDLTYLKPDLQQTDSSTSQAMLHKILIALDFTIRNAQNTFSTVQLFHEYRLPEKSEILNIC